MAPLAEGRILGRILGCILGGPGLYDSMGRTNGLRPLPPGPTGGIGTATKGNREGHREVAGATYNFQDFEEFAENLFF